MCHRASPAPSSSVVTAELELLEAALDRAERGVAGAVFVSGESGVGKTRLLRELERRRRRARRARAARRVPGLRRGRAGLRADRRGPARLARELDPGAFDALLGPARARAGAAAARAGPRRPAPSGHRDRRRVRPGPPVRGRCAVCSTGWPPRRPCCSRSRTSTGPTARRSSSSPRCCAACATSACCSSAPIAATSCTAAIRCARSWPRRSAASGVQRLELEPFSPAELAAQVAGILGGAADPELVARLHARCEGNAFFAEELLAASGGAAGPLPPSLHEVARPAPGGAAPGRARGAAGGRGRGQASRPSAARRRHGPARARAARSTARGGDPPRARARQRRLRLPPRPAGGGGLRRPAPRRADRAAPGARRGPERRPEPRRARARGGAGPPLAARRTACPRRSPPTWPAGLEAERASAFAEAGQHFERALEIWDLVEDADERSELGLAASFPTLRRTRSRRRASPCGRARAQGAGARRWHRRRWSRRRCAHERLGSYLWAGGRQRCGAGRLPRRGARPTGGAADARRWRASSPPKPRSSCCAGPAEEARAGSRARRGGRARGGERAVEGHALDTLGAAMSMTGDWAGGERALREAMGIAEELSERLRARRVPTSASAICLDKQGRLEEAAELALEGARMAERVGVLTHACSSPATPAGGSHLPGPPRRGAGDRRARARGGAEGDGRGSWSSTPPRISRCAAAGSTPPRSISSARASSEPTSDSIWIGNTACGQAEVALWRSDPEGARRIAAPRAGRRRRQRVRPLHRARVRRRRCAPPPTARCARLALGDDAARRRGAA